MVKTGVAPLRLFNTTTFVSVMLPEFLTVPVKVSVPPGSAGLTGQAWVSTRPGVVSSGQVAEAEFETGRLRVIDTPGGGATFEVCLPALDEDEGEDDLVLLQGDTDEPVTADETGTPEDSDMGEDSDTGEEVVTPGGRPVGSQQADGL